MKKVLITGANGFIGKHLIQEFLSNNFKVYAGVRERSDTRDIEGLDVEILRLTYLSQEELTEQLKGIELSVVVHNAGVTVAKDEKGYFLGNTTTTENLLGALANHRLESFIYMSSLAARGPGIEAIDSPISPYGQSKLEAERLVRKSGIPFTIVRPTAVYGPGDGAFGPVFSWAKKGVFLQLGSPTRKMTFVHVQDLVRLVSSNADANGEVLYGWDGANYIQRDLTNALKNTIGKSGIILTIPSWAFRFGTGIIDFFVRRVFNQFWDYPPMKVVELIADDWSILESEMPEKCEYLISEGFSQTYTHWLTHSK